MSVTANEDAFAGGDTSAATKADIEARNTAMQDYIDAQKVLSDAFATAEADYKEGLAEAEQDAYTADPKLKSGAPAV